LQSDEVARYCRARAGFGGLELSTRLSEQFGQDIDIVLIDQSEGFIFGFSKLDVMFGRKPASDVLHPYRDIDKPGLRFVQTTIRAIDPASKRVETDSGAFEGDIMVVALGADLDPERKVAVLSEGPAMPYDLFLGVPAHRVPAVVEESGMTVDGWIPVNPLTLETAFPDVYAVGDVTSVGTPKAGVFSEGQAAVVAPQIASKMRATSTPVTYDGHGTCYLEFG
jgi:NADH dehydrogenase FAD-containing subunit